MKKLLPLIVILVSTCSAIGQVGIGNTDPKASLDIIASNVAAPSNTDGLLIPRIDDFPLTDPTLDQDGMMVFVTGNGTPAEGFYYWDQGTTSWITIIGSSGPIKIDDLTDGKSDDDGSDDGASIFLGINAGLGDDSGDNRNVGIGFQSLQNNVTGENNVGIGYNTLQNTTGNHNIAMGTNALLNNTTGAINVAIGGLALEENDTGISNTGIGYIAGRLNETGSQNTAVGIGSLYYNTSGSSNTVLGGAAGRQLSGDNNVAIGFAAGGNLGTQKNIDNSVFLGYFAGYSENASNKLYIENSTADADNALIYGEFDTNILRTNSEFQIGNPTGTGYAFPTVDGTSGQVLSTDGNGQITFSTPLEDIDWYESGTVTAPTAITDDIFTQGNVGIGITTPLSPLHIGTITPFDLDHANIGQDGLFIIGGGDNSGQHAVGGSLVLSPPSSTRSHQRKAAISSVQTSGDVDHTGLAFYVHGNAINQSPMVERMRLDHQGYLGLNTIIPSATLDVVGSMQFEDGNEAAGFVLASDATGNATWTDPATLIPTGVEKIDDLTDGKSDSDGSNDGSSIFLGINAGAADDSSDNRNIGIGYQVLENNTTGQNNVGVGYLALNNNVDGGQNTAIGLSSLNANTTGAGNTAVGYQSLLANDNGINNTAIGQGALNFNSSGGYNTASGAQALFFTSGGSNTGSGYRALYTNTSGARNSAYGLESLNLNSTGSDNVALGYRAGRSSLGSNNIFLGASAGFSELGSNKLYIESSNADPDNALIYGEFDNNILRTNGELQIGNPTGTGYAFPTTDGTANYILQTDGNGQLSFVDGSSLGSNWSLTGNAIAGGQFIGSTNNIDVSFRTNNTEKMRLTTDGQLEFYNTGNSVFIGEQAGENDDLTANNNTFVGYRSGQDVVDGFGNTALGYNSLLNTTTGDRNVSLGSGTLLANTTGTDNIAIGSSVMVSNTSEGRNIAIGYAALFEKEGGNSNVAIGYRAGAKDITSDQNVYIGHEAGGGFIPDPDEVKSGNVFVGYRAGYDVDGDDQLVIENSDSTTPLIYGTFNTNEVGINWNSSTALPNTLSVNGDASKNVAGAWLANSDRRLKKEIQTIDGVSALEKLKQLRGVTYLWNDSKTGIERPAHIQYGFIAQEIREVFPEKVTKDGLGYYQTAYGDYDALFVQAIKEQQSQIEILSEENKKLRHELSIYKNLEARISALEEKSESSLESADKE